jgi:hypothetical protein
MGMTCTLPSARDLLGSAASDSTTLGQPQRMNAGSDGRCVTISDYAGL